MSTSVAQRPDFSDLLEPLRRINDLVAMEDVADAVRTFAQRAAKVEGVSRTLLRSDAIELLKARKVGAPAQLIDNALRSAKRTTSTAAAGHPAQGTGVLFADVELWPESVDGKDLILALMETVQRYVHVTREAALAVALWVLHTHALDAAHCSPRLAILSPTKRCGKTTLLHILAALTPRPLPTSNVTTAVVFRTIEAHHPTLLIDEADAFANDQHELRGVINAGHSRGGHVLRCVGDEHEPRAFSVFGAVAIAAIGRLPETILDRSIVIEMHRKQSGDTVEHLRRIEIAALEPLRRRCARWAADNVRALADTSVEAPIELHDRAADNWEALLAIAAALGESWLSRAVVASRVTSGSSEMSDGLAEQLLEDIRGLLAVEHMGEAVIMTRDLLRGLTSLEDRPWQDVRGKPLNGHGLARLLRPFQVKPVTVRCGSTTLKAYHRAELLKTFARYLPAQTETSETPSGAPTAAVVDVSIVSLAGAGHTQARPLNGHRLPRVSARYSVKSQHGSAH